MSSHRWSSRDSWVGGALPYLRAAPTVAARSRLGPKVMRVCSDWYVRSTLQSVRTSCPCSCRRVVSSSLSVSLRWPLAICPLQPYLRRTQCVALAWNPSIQRRVCSLMLFTTSCYVAMMILSKMAPHSDLVSCSVLRHCLMMMPISCVVLLQKAFSSSRLPPAPCPEPCQNAREPRKAPPRFCPLPFCHVIGKSRESKIAYQS